MDDEPSNEPKVIYVVDRDRDRMPGWVKGLLAVALAVVLLWQVDRSLNEADRQAEETVCEQFPDLAQQAGKCDD